MLLFIFHDVVEEFSILQVFGDKEDTFFSLDDFIEMKNVRVSNSFEYFNLSMYSFLILDC